MREIPSLDTKEIERLIRKEKRRVETLRLLRNAIFSLLIVAAVSILVATLWMPVLRIYGSSMNPTLKEGDYLLSLNTKNYHTGDVIAFYYNNKVIVKRVIAKSGDWVNIDKDGTVYVNNEKIEEPYIQDKAFGITNITLPYQVPDAKVFVMGDERKTSVDSRNTAIGCISQEQIVGILKFRIWPLNHIGWVKS